MSAKRSSSPRSVLGWLPVVVLAPVLWSLGGALAHGQTTGSIDALPEERVLRATPAPVRGGGGTQADFDSLIDLIVATIAPESWEDVGGDGAIEGFPGGVYVDPQGILRALDRSTADQLAPHWRRWNLKRQRLWDQADVARRSKLRKVSLVRLLEAISARRAAGQDPTESMMHLAGLERLDYLIFDRERGDCILAGPADAWKIDGQGRHVAHHSGRPVLRFEDLVVLLENAYFGRGQFLCAITPTQEGLAQAQQYVAQSAGRPVVAGGRDAWLQGLKSALGLQRIEVEGIAADTRVARVIVEADHHMKQIGIGLAPGTDRVDSYLEMLVKSGRIPERMDVLRWWFTLRPDAVGAASAGELYVFGPQAVQVLSENELLTRHGERIHTGQSDPLNEQFAQDFTADFAEIARRYPVYADLDNVFRLALLAAIVAERGLPDGAALDLPQWLESDVVPLATGRTPQWVESVVNHRQVNRRRFVAAVSGGVRFTAPPLTSLASREGADAPVGRVSDRAARWWWD